MRAEERRMLLPMITVARTVLSEYDEDEIPHRLVRVAKSSARRLPPPFEDSLIAFIAEDSTFRADVAEAWSNDPLDDPLVDAFLDDPDVAAPLLAQASATADADREARDIDRLTARIAQLEQEQVQAKTRVAEARARAQEQARDAKAAAKRARRGIESALAQARRETDRARESLDAVNRKVSALEQQNAELEDQIRRIAQRAAKRSEQPVEAVTQTPIPAGDSVEVARWLDDVERTLRPFRETRRGEQRDEAIVGFGLPPGVAPDSPEAIDVLDSLAPVTVILDGYNVASALGVEGFGDARGRKSTLVLGGRVQRHTGALVVVVFDAVGVDGRESYVSDAGIDVRFSREVSADDTIVDLIRSSGARTAVVTNDRELRERSAALGALALWSDALVAWANA